MDLIDKKVKKIKQKFEMEEMKLKNYAEPISLNESFPYQFII